MFMADFYMSLCVPMPILIFTLFINNFPIPVNWFLMSPTQGNGVYAHVETQEMDLLLDIIKQLILVFMDIYSQSRPL